MAQPTARRGVTRWRRSGLLALPALGAFGLLVLATFEGVLPVRLSVHDLDVRLAADRLDAPGGLQGYSGYSKIKQKDPVTGEYRGALVADLPRAELPEGMCMSITTKLPVVGYWTVKLHSNSKVVLTDTLLSASSLTGGSLTLNPSTTDGKPPNADGSNVKDPVILGIDPGSMEPFEDKEGEGFGLSAKGPVVGMGIDAQAKGAIISGTLKIGLPTVNINKGNHLAAVCHGSNATDTGNQGGEK